MFCVLTQPCPTLCDPMDYNPCDSSVHGILQARILEWDATPSSSRSSPSRDQTHVSYISGIGRRLFTTELSGKPQGTDVRTPNDKAWHPYK